MASRAETRVPLPVWEAVRAPFAALAEATDARWVEPPLLQPLSRLLDFAGEGLRARLFVVQGDEGEELCLRPDFTLPVALAHLASQAPEARYLYEGLAFRSAPRGDDRPSEFRQIGTEAFGASPEPARQDAEMVALAWRAAQAGGRRDLAVTLGDIGLVAAFVRGLGVSERLLARLVRAMPTPGTLAAELERAQAGGQARGGRLSALLATLSETDAAEVVEDLWRLADVRPVGGRSAADIVHRLSARASADAGPRLGAREVDLITRFLAVSGPPPAALEAADALAREAGVDLTPEMQAWDERLAVLQAVAGGRPPLTLAANFARPFAYYDGVLFEVRSAALGPDQPVAAGGRYDGLLARLDSSAPPGAVGCVVRPGRAWDGADR